jgi:thioesterase domain-containing protein
MRPSDIVLVDSIPLLPGGKVDAPALMISATAARCGAESAPDADAVAVADGPPSARSLAIVARAWRRTFDRTSLHRNLRFDEGGGDSLRLLQFVFHMEQLGGALLPLDTFPADLRPSGFAYALDAILSERPVASSEQRRIILLPGAGKDEPRLARFRAGCAPTLKVVPIDYGDWSEWVTPKLAFTTLVAGVVSQIETIAPTGPLLLAGYSMGGCVAYAAAQMLIAAGRSVELVALLDTTALPPCLPSQATVPGSRMQELRDLAAAWKAGRATDEIAHIMVRRLLSSRWASLLRLSARLRNVWWPGQLGFFLSWRLNMGLLGRTEQGWASVAAAAPPLRAPVILFRSREHGPGIPTYLGWAALCANLTVQQVDGDHRSMLLEPNLAPLCADFISLVAIMGDHPAAHASVDAARRGTE